MENSAEEIVNNLEEDLFLPTINMNPVSLASNPNDFYRMAFQFQQIMMIYESAIRQIETKLDILNKENVVNRKRNPIETVKSRIKSPESISNKLIRKNLPVTFDSMMENLDDIAGVRVICPYISDIYTVRDMLLKQPDLKLIHEDDYIENPKESGYRSLHVVIETPVYLSKSEHLVRVEIQLRTIAMDFWASLEHELHYKNTTKVPESVRRELHRVAETIAMTDREMEEIAMELQALD
ncbi:MAG: GTP pyrophosphokinase family protein [Treponema sp.]|nr:GTP pyrophosphokinase family protein [Treponema sp.]